MASMNPRFVKRTKYLRFWKKEIPVVDDESKVPFIEFHVEFILRQIHQCVSRSDTGETTILDSTEEPPIGKFFWVSPQEFMANGISAGICSTFLTQMGVRTVHHSSIIPLITSYARKMANSVSKDMGSSKRLVMQVVIISVSEYRIYEELLNEVLRESLEEHEGRGYGVLIPASKSSIDALEKVTVTLGDDGDSNEIKCMVCLEELPSGSIVTRMPCSHMFHESCIVQWLEKSNSCPMCRFVLTTEVA